MGASRRHRMPPRFSRLKFREFSTDEWIVGSLIAAVLACGILQQFWLYRHELGFTALFTDDITLFLNCRGSWLMRPSIFNLRDTPTPLMDILGGLWLRVAGGSWSRWLFLQSAMSWISCAFIALIAGELFPKAKPAGFVPAAAFAGAALSPLRALQSMGAMEFPWIQAFGAAGIFCWLRYRSRARPQWLYAAAGCFLLGSAVHFNGWHYLALFSLWCLSRILLERNGRRRNLPAALLIACFYVVAAGLFVLPRFLAADKAVYSSTGFASPFLDPILEIQILFPALCLLALISAFALRRDAGFDWSYLLWPLGSLALAGLLHLLGLAGSFIHLTHLFGLRQLLVPLAAGSLTLIPRARRRTALLLGMASVIFWSSRTLPRYLNDPGRVSFNDSSVRVFALVKALRVDGLLPDASRVLVPPIPEYSPPPHRLLGPPPAILADPDKVLVDRFCDFSHGPCHFAWRVPPYFPSFFSLSPAAMRDVLRRENIRLVVAQGQEGRHLRPFMAEAGAFPPYHFLVPADARGLKAAAIHLTTTIDGIPLAIKRGKPD